MIVSKEGPASQRLETVAGWNVMIRQKTTGTNSNHVGCLRIAPSRLQSDCSFEATVVQVPHPAVMSKYKFSNSNIGSCVVPYFDLDTSGCQELFRASQFIEGKSRLLCSLH